MREFTNKEEKNYLKWEKQRKKKWIYIFVHGTIYWGLPVGITLFLTESHFKTENMNLHNFITTVSLFGIGGLFSGLSQYNRIDKAFLKLGDDDQILNGIKTLETEKVWNYENLIIAKQDEDTLVVKNELFWFEDNSLSNNLNECLDLVMKDFERLKKNKDFDIYSNQYKVTIQVFDNSEKIKPLIEMNI